MADSNTSTGTQERIDRRLAEFEDFIAVAPEAPANKESLLLVLKVANFLRDAEEWIALDHYASTLRAYCICYVTESWAVTNKIQHVFAELIEYNRAAEQTTIFVESDEIADLLVGLKAMGYDSSVTMPQLTAALVWEPPKRIEKGTTIAGEVLRPKPSAAPFAFALNELSRQVQSYQAR